MSDETPAQIIARTRLALRDALAELDQLERLLTAAIHTHLPPQARAFTAARLAELQHQHNEQTRPC